MRELFVFVLLFTVGASHHCLRNQANAQGTLPTFARDIDTDDGDRIQTGNGIGTQAIIPDYMFDCCGNVTSWGASVRQGGRGDVRRYDIGFQVWRPSPTVQDTGCYSLVGQNLFTSIEMLAQHTIAGLVPTNTLQVSIGDVVGLYVFNDRGPPRGVQLNTGNPASFWYATGPMSAGNPDCPLPVGAGRALSLSRTDAAPIITVGVESFDCPTMAMTSSSAQPSPTSSSAQPLPTSSPSSSSSMVVIETPTPDTTTNPPPTTSSGQYKVSSLTPTPSPATNAAPTISPSSLPPSDSLTGTAIGASVGGVALTGAVIVVIVAAVLCVKKRISNHRDTAAVATSIELHSDGFQTIPVKHNESYVATVSTRNNEAYGIHEELYDGIDVPDLSTATENDYIYDYI